MADKNPILVWFRNDLRLADYPALHSAAAQGPILPVYILEDAKMEPFAPGGAARWFLHAALQDLAASLHKAGAPLILRRGDPAKILPELAKAAKASGVVWTRSFEPHRRERDERLQDALTKQGLAVGVHPGYLLFQPEAIKTGGGGPYKVFTPFAKACFNAPAPGEPLPAPRKLTSVAGIASDTLADWQLVPKKAVWPKGLARDWEVTEAAAQRRLKHFIKDILHNYKASRDRPAANGTSRLSPYLHHGLISPRQAWDALHHAAGAHPAHGSHAERFLLELLWRDFNWHLIWHFPQMTDAPLTAAYAKFPWRQDAKGLKAWQQGRTGYPIVDAGMRQLWQTGWMHNRVRMITASFLIKDLLIDWRTGMAWFWDTLVDGDLGSNTGNWQWVAGCGADASPFFRVFNPILQGEKFDPQGDYVRRFVPELAKLDGTYIHRPWLAPEAALKAAGIALDTTYPRPIVDHGEARIRALAALKTLRGPGAGKTGPHDLFD